ncbi:MAG TPA: DUF1705 domain-containing protein, partial [Accumulibacter sp.]|uniref:DUF1705 domain-containing protein n=1 Tax=Accumulibacter sp. TaxID=2053492 RepID=UPI002C2685EE
MSSPRTPLVPSRRSQALAGGDPFVIPATVEQLLLAASIFWVLTANRPFFAAVLGGHSLTAVGTWGLLLATGVLLVAMHFTVLALLATRLTVKPLLALLIVTTVIASHFMSAYGVFLDPSMLRNVLRTDVLEARELLSPAVAVQLSLYALLPLLLLWRTRIVVRPPLRACGVRLLALLLAAVAMAGSLAVVYKPFSSLLRNHKEVRYLITPAN